MLALISEQKFGLHPCIFFSTADQQLNVALDQLPNLVEEFHLPNHGAFVHILEHAVNSLPVDLSPLTWF